MKKLLLVISIVCLCGLSLVGCGNKEVTPKNTDNQPVVEDTTPKYTWKEAFSDTIKEFDPDGPYAYVLYDLDKDNEPEMLLRSGEIEAEKEYAIYDFRDGKLASNKIDKVGGNTLVAGLYEESTIVFQRAYMGVEEISKLKYKQNGDYELEVIVPERVIGEGEEYTLLESLGFRGLRDTTPLSWKSNPIDNNLNEINLVLEPKVEEISGDISGENEA